MRILVLGAGGLGGYFGGRLARAGVDVTFQVRPRRAAQIAANGLVVTSPLGDFSLPVKTVQRDTVRPGFDAILFSCKAYDLDDAIDSIRPAAAGARIVPVLNGLKHLPALDAAFGAELVLGGTGLIGASLDPDGTVRHLNRSHGLVFGARAPGQAAFCEALEAALAPGGFDSRNSPAIMQEMWEKFVFLCTLASATTLFRTNTGAINRTDNGGSVIRDLLAECEAAATAAGHPSRAKAGENARTWLLDPASGNAASMMRDMLAGGPVEADHIVGDMLSRATAAGSPAPMLRAAYVNLQAYQTARAAT